MNHLRADGSRASEQTLCLGPGVTPYDADPPRPSGPGIFSLQVYFVTTLARLLGCLSSAPTKVPNEVPICKQEEGA